MHAEVLSGGIVPREQLLLDVRLAGGGDERGGPVFGGEDV
jgi:hypothetical protein